MIDEVLAASVAEVSGDPPEVAEKIRPADVLERKILRALVAFTAAPCWFSTLMVTALVAEVLARALKGAEVMTNWVAPPAVAAPAPAPSAIGATKATTTAPAARPAAPARRIAPLGSLRVRRAGTRR